MDVEGNGGGLGEHYGKKKLIDFSKFFLRVNEK